MKTLLGEKPVSKKALKFKTKRGRRLLSQGYILLSVVQKPKTWLVEAQFAPDGHIQTFKFDTNGLDEEVVKQNVINAFENHYQETLK